MFTFAFVACSKNHPYVHILCRELDLYCFFGVLSCIYEAIRFSVTLQSSNKWSLCLATAVRFRRWIPVGQRRAHLRTFARTHYTHNTQALTPLEIILLWMFWANTYFTMIFYQLDSDCTLSEGKLTPIVCNNPVICDKNKTTKMKRTMTPELKLHGYKVACSWQGQEGERASDGDSIGSKGTYRVERICYFLPLGLELYLLCNSRITGYCTKAHAWGVPIQT